MKIVVVTKKPVLTQFGRLVHGLPVDVPPQLAKFLIDRGDAVAYETKERMDRPIEADGTAALSSAWHQGHPLQPQTLSASEPGAKRRGRPRKEA